MKPLWSFQIRARSPPSQTPSVSTPAALRARIVFEASHGRQWAAGIELMAATRESAENICGHLIHPVGMDYKEWTPFAERVFAASPHREDESASEPATRPE